MRLDDFRRLCVSYGEARAKYARVDMPRDYTDAWLTECNKLWAEIETAERIVEKALSKNQLRSP